MPTQLFQTRRILIPVLLALAVIAAAAGMLLFPRTSEAAVGPAAVSVAPTERFTAAAYTIDIPNDAGAAFSAAAPPRTRSRSCSRWGRACPMRTSRRD